MTPADRARITAEAQALAVSLLAPFWTALAVLIGLALVTAFILAVRVVWWLLP